MNKGTQITLLSTSCMKKRKRKRKIIWSLESTPMRCMDCSLLKPPFNDVYNWRECTRKEKKRKEKITFVYDTSMNLSPLSKCLTRGSAHLRVTSHTRLRAHDHYTASTLIGGKAEPVEVRFTTPLRDQWSTCMSR
jgi:hypothetical protein